MPWPGLIARYGDRLSIEGKDSPVTLLEGNTPLIPAHRLGDWIGDFELYLKFEGMNPTGSFKDRGMTTAVTDAKAKGARTLICASTGNTAASAAAYAARAGLRCVVLIPEGKVALGKLAAALAYGAEVVSIQGSFDEALCLVKNTILEGVFLVNSLNPARIEGQKTAAWEVTEQLGAVPDWLALPVGNAGNITSYWKGFREQAGARPKLLGVQAEGAAPIVLGRPIEFPETRATAIRIGNPARWQEASAALSESGGQILAVSDEEIFEAYHQVARLEGVFCEPSSAASLAGLRKAFHASKGDFEGRKVVAVLTGHGLKDPDSAIGEEAKIVHIEATAEALIGVLK